MIQLNGFHMNDMKYHKVL